MKTPNRSLKLSMVPYFAALVLGIPATLQAQTNGTWSNLAGSSWGTATNWTGSAIAAGADAVADFSTLNITAARTITLDGARTVGLLRFGDATTVNVDQTINTGTAGPLTLDSTTGTGIIEVLNRTVTIGAVLAGTDGITVNNGVSTGGTLILGAANTFTGGLTVQGAIVQFNNNASAGAGSNNPINILGSGSTAVSRVLANGGVTNASPITIESTTNVAGFGVLQQTGTGLGTFSGPITVNGAPSAGGHFVGGTAAGNALVLSGPITSGVTLVQRDGFVRYGGGGTGYTLLLVTNTAQVGATNGIATTATLNLGPSNPGTLDLNGFDQTLAAVNMGYNINPTAFPGTINLGARTLTMEGDITTGEQGGTALAHAINAAAGGTLNAGATSRNLVVNDNPAPDDLVVTNAALAGSGGFIKTGAGTLSLNNTTATGPLFIDQGTLAIGRTGLPGSF
jgi:autotransporter-associated beta strand protein